MKAILVSPDPGDGSFASLMMNYSRSMKRSLEELGHQVQVITEEDALADPDHTLQTVARFNPDFLTCISFSNLLHAAGTDGRLLHLDIPTVALWDDPIGGVAGTVLRFTPEELPAPPRNRWFRAWESARGVKERLFGFPHPEASENQMVPPAFRRLLANPYWLHVAWDSGHAETFLSLGLAAPGQVIWHPVSTYAPFLEMGERAAKVEPTVEVGFCGNIYLSSLRANRFWNDPFYRSMCESAVARKLRDPGGTGWDFLLAELAAVRPSLRRRLGLYTHMKEFWEFYLFLLWSVLTTLPRLEFLSAVAQEVTLFGLFADRASRKALADYPNLKYGGNLDLFEELPRQYAATQVNLCVANGLIYRGTPSKLLDCLASGGFALSEPKADLVRLFGSKVEDIFFHSPEELREKVHYYLARPGRRREIVESLRSDIKKRCTHLDLFTEVVQAVRSFQPQARRAG